VAPDDPLGDASARVAGAVLEDRRRTPAGGLTAAEVTERVARGEINDTGDPNTRVAERVVGGHGVTVAPGSAPDAVVHFVQDVKIPSRGWP